MISIIVLLSQCRCCLRKSRRPVNTVTEILFPNDAFGILPHQPRRQQHNYQAALYSLHYFNFSLLHGSLSYTTFCDRRWSKKGSRRAGSQVAAKVQSLHPQPQQEMIASLYSPTRIRILNQRGQRPQLLELRLLMGLRFWGKLPQGQMSKRSSEGQVGLGSCQSIYCRSIARNRNGRNQSIQWYVLSCPRIPMLMTLC